MLGASLANFLQYNDYPLLRPEVALVATGLILLAGVAAVLYARMSRLGRAALEGLLVFLALDLNADLPWLAMTAGFATVLVCLWRRVSVLPALAILAAVVLFTTLVGLGERRAPIDRTEGTAPPASSAPPIVHLILDEHIGLAGITDPAVREELERFYTSRGFRLFSRAYSQHFHTVNAIPDMLNFGESGSSRGSQDGVVVGRTAYLSLLRQRGYAVNIYESDFADFCSAADFASCTRYWSPSLAWFDRLPLSSSEKARLIGIKFWALSSAAASLANFYSLAISHPWMRPLGLRPYFLEQTGVSSSVSALGAFDALAADLRRARPGQAYFAHLLLPHYPYATASDCTLLPPSRWGYRWEMTPVAARQQAYHRQLRCTLRKVGAVLDALEASPAGRNAVVIIHGDHGSRITNIEPRADLVGRFADADLVAGFSTLFAVRGPQAAAGVDPTPVAVPALLGRLARSGFTATGAAAASTGPHTVMLDDAEWQPRRRVPLPRDWQNRGE
jgi:hypothetical protein